MRVGLQRLQVDIHRRPLLVFISAVHPQHPLVSTFVPVMLDASWVRQGRSLDICADPHPLTADGHSSIVASCRLPEPADGAPRLARPAESANRKEVVMSLVRLASTTPGSVALAAATGVRAAVLPKDGCRCWNWATDAVRRAICSSHASARPLAITTVVYTPLGRERKASAGESGA